MINKPTPFNRIGDLIYYDYLTGVTIEVVKMREFYDWGWDTQKKKWVPLLTRRYQLSREDELNPQMKG